MNGVAEVIAFIVIFGVLAVLIGACVLVVRLVWRVLTNPSRPASRTPRPPPRPDDWDDEEYIARHHH